MNKAKSFSLFLGSLSAAFVLSGPFAASALADAPTVTIDPASAITASGAHLSGEVDPAGLETTCAFEYVSDAVFQNGRKEVQQLTIEATGGTFKLGFGGEETAAIPYGASAAEAQSALEGIAAIGTGGVTVSGGPLESAPFAITFQAPGNVAELGIEPAGLVGISGGGLLVTVEGAVPGFEGAQSAPCESALNGTGAVPVVADATGLNPGTVYHLRLRASNQDGTAFAVGPTFPTEAAAPVISETFVSAVTETTATLNARIDANGAPTSYRFEYLTLTEYKENGKTFAGAETTPGSVVEEDSEPHLLSATITGLAPGTAYRYRAVAESSKSPSGGTLSSAGPFRTNEPPSAETCPNAAVREQQKSTYLPECRAYEIINTPGLDLGDVNRIVYSSDDGSAVAYLSVGAADDALGGGVTSISLARRGAGGWTSVSADPASTGVAAYSTGFNTFKAFSTDLSREMVTSTLPMNTADVDGVSDLYRVDVGLGTTTLMSQEEDTYPTEVGGASSDLDRVVWLGYRGGVGGMWVSDGATRELVSRFPNGDPIGLVVQFASPMYARGVNVGGEGGLTTSQFVQRGGAHGVSDDARRIYFTTPGGGVFVRDLAAQPPLTVPVGISSRSGDVGVGHGVQFLSATHDGSSAYVASDEQLTDAATPGGGIYRFDLASGAMTQLSPAAGPGGIGIRGAIVSDDQSHVYFTSASALAGTAEAGEMNAYVWTSADGFRFLGEVDTKYAVTRVTPDGRYALLMTSASIDGAPNGGHQALYRYDYAGDEVVCVSCRPDGSTSTGAASIDVQSHGEPGAPLINNRALSFDGDVAFTSRDQIVAGDRNSVEDVYLFHDGTTSLLTPGNGAAGSYVGDISDDGRSVSIMTRSALVGADRDPDEYDAYDVHVDGGFLEPPPAAAPCEGESCRTQTQTPSAPAAAVPSTPSFIGPANPKPCAKGKTRRNGRCVNVRKPRKHQSKKHRSQKHTRANANGRTGR